MMLDLPKEHELLHLHLQSLYNDRCEDALKKVRAKAWERYVELKLPTKKTEQFQYVKLRHLYDRNYVPHTPSDITREQFCDYICPESKDSVLVFVNGSYCPQLSSRKAIPDQVVITSLNEAASTYGALLNHHAARMRKEEQDPFAALNLALHLEGLFIYLPPKCILNAPIQVLHLIDVQGQSPILMPRLHVFAGAHAEAKFALTTARLSGSHFGINHAADFNLEEGANLHITQKVLNDLAESWHFDALRGQLKKNSHLTCVNTSKGSFLTRYDYSMSLIGENAEALLNGIGVLEGHSELHQHVFMEHQAPHCRSSQLFKAVLNGSSRSSFEGKIYVCQAAQKTEAYQLNSHLLLSDHALAYSKPNLEIFADDVKASHGATVGQLNAEHLFYLRTRGLSDAEAKAMLIEGFCKDVVDLIPLESLRSL